MTSTPASVACARCRAAIDPTRAAMSGDGLICPRCEQRENVRDQGSWGSGSFGPLGWGVISLFCNPFMIPSILAITGGMSELRLIKEARAVGGDDPALSSRHTSAVFGIILGAFGPLMILAVIGFVFLAFAASAVAGVAGASRYEDPYAYDDYGYPSDYASPDPYATDYASPSLAAPSGRPIGYLDGSRPASEQMAEHVSEAQRLGLRPYVFAHADWCAPCRAVAEHENDPAMVDAFQGVYLIDVDIDTVRTEELDALGFRVVGVPSWYGVDESGRFDGRTITSGAWGEDIPANMAPPLRQFFHPEG